MSTHDDKVKRLLDGEIDEAEIAADPVLASLAERIFGLNIEPITPTKPSQEIAGPEVEVVTAVTNADSMIEVIPGLSPPIQDPGPLPELPAIPGAKENAKSGNGLKFLGIAALIVSVANLFGAFGFLNSQCTAVKCDSSATRLNWLGIHNINNELGWSMPFPEMGIPDYVAVACSILLIIVAFRKK